MVGQRERALAAHATTRSPVLARVVIAAAEIYEGTAAHLREGGHELPPLESADLDDVLASVTAAVAAMRVSSSMIDTAAALRRERMEGVAS